MINIKLNVEGWTWKFRVDLWTPHAYRRNNNRGCM